jgi:hypothetical protein
LYLDFDGDVSNHNTPAFDTDSSPTTFSDSEIAVISEIWARVAEKYAPFNINVTTADPGNENRRETMRILIGGDGAWAGGGIGGTSTVGDFYNLNGQNTAWVFPVALSNNPKYVADATAHEAGHGFGLRHHSTWDGGGNLVDAYDHGDASTAPIMGSAYLTARSVWANSPSDLGANSIQDDLAVLSGANNNFGYRTRTNGGSAASAEPLSPADGTATGYGIITRTTDTDYYSFSTTGGSCSFTVTPGHWTNIYGGSSNGVLLQPRIEIRDDTDSILHFADDAGTASQSITTTLSAGDYFFVVTSHGGYSDIGSYDYEAEWDGLPPSGSSASSSSSSSDSSESSSSDSSESSSSDSSGSSASSNSSSSSSSDSSASSASSESSSSDSSASSASSESSSSDSSESSSSDSSESSSSDSSPSSNSSSSQSQEYDPPTLIGIKITTVQRTANTIIRGKAFDALADGLEPDATAVGLYLDGVRVAYGIVDGDAVIFPYIVHDAGVYRMAITQLNGDIESELSNEVSVRVADNLNVIQKIPPPTITPIDQSVHFHTPVTVTISTAVPNAVIKYTTNGAKPGFNSKVYRGPFKIYGNTLVKARVYAADLRSTFSKANIRVVR